MKAHVAPLSTALVYVPLFLVPACAERATSVGSDRGSSATTSVVPWAAPASALVTLPLDLHEDRYLYVRGEVNGHATDIVVDSGAGITVVDRALAGELGIVGDGEVDARGVGGEKRTVSLGKNVRIRLGTLDLEPLTVALIDLEEVNEKLGRRMPVIVGKELFHAMPVTIDYAGRRLILHDAKRFEAPAGAVAATTRPVDNGHTMIEARLEDLEPAWFVIDTGSGGTLDVHEPYVKANDLLKRYPRQAERQIAGVGGSLPARLASSDSFTFAGQTFRAMPVTLAIEPRGAFASQTSAGTIGAGILSRFVVTFDLPRERLLFEPGDRVSAPFDRDRMGLSCVTQDGKVLVDFVAKDGPAAAAGIAVGDEIVAVDGSALFGLALRSELRRKMRGPAGTSVRLTLRGGAERVVILADSF